MANTTGKKFGGREKGTPNKSTKEIRDTFKNILNSNIDNLDVWIKKVAEKNPEKAVNILLKISEFILPKLNKIEVEEMVSDDIENLTDEELEKEINRYLMQKNR